MVRTTHQRGRDNSVGIATRYRLDGPGIDSRWGRDFSHPSRPAPGAHPASYTMGTGSFPGVKRPGCGVDHPPPSSAEVEGRVELYIFSPSGPSQPVLGRALPLPLFPTKYYLLDQIRRMGWVGHEACIGNWRVTYRVLVGRPEGKRPLEIPRP